MKKIMSFVLASAALALAASCQKEVNPYDLSNADTPVTVTVQLPDGINTKAYGDGTTVDKVYFEIWSKGFETKIAELTTSIGDSGATFNFQLVRGAIYSFVFWAVNGANEVYQWSALSNINIEYNKLNADSAGNPAGNQESMDAFYGNYTTEAIKGNESLSVTLKRPFGQLNFGTDDMSASSVGQITVNSTKIQVSGLAKTFDATKGIGGGSQDITFVSNVLPTETHITVGNVSYTYLSMNYLLPSGSTGATPAVKADFNITYGTETKDVTHEFAAVPIKANYRTNIVGSLFTATGTVTTTIDPAFETPAGQVTVNQNGTNETNAIS